MNKFHYAYNRMLLNEIRDKELYFFCAGEICEKVLRHLNKKKYLVKGIFDNNSARWGEWFWGWKILSVDDLMLIDPQKTVIVITSDYFKEIEIDLRAKGFYSVFDYSALYDDKSLADRSYVRLAPSVILDASTSFDFRVSRQQLAVEVEEYTQIGCKFIFESDQGFIHIGKRSYVGPSTLISRSRIDIGEDVTISWGCYLYDHNAHSLSWQEWAEDIRIEQDNYHKNSNVLDNKNWSVVKTAPIKICNRVWIGFNAIILKGVTVGEGAVIGAGAVVTNDIPPYTVAAGNPAKVVKTIKEK